MKKIDKRLTLATTRIRAMTLVDRQLDQVAGGATYPGGSCGCKPTICPK